jgi:hypothetical protein
LTLGKNVDASPLSFAIANSAKHLSGAALLVLLVLAIVSTAAFFEAEKEFERRKAAGDPETAQRPFSWLELTRRFLPAEKRRAYFVFLGACAVLLIVTLALDL